MNLETDYSYFDDGRLPLYMRAGTIAWVEEGRVPGHFLCKVIENDLFGAVNYADAENQKCLVDWVRFFYNCVPQGCWGKDALKTWPEQLEKWVKQDKVKRKVRTLNIPEKGDV